MAITHRSTAISFILALAFSAPARAHGYTVGALQIGHPWSRPSPSGAQAAVGYLTVTNGGTKPDRLLGGSTPAAARVEIHSMSMTGGIMRMRPVSGGLTLPPGQTVKLEPGSLHIMFIAPKHAFKLGDHIPATLRFERAGEVKVAFSVQAASPDGPTSSPMKMDMH